MNNHRVMQEYDPSKETLLEKYDRSFEVYSKLMQRSLEQRFQGWVNRKCESKILKYQECVKFKWPWQMKQCDSTLDDVSKCRLSYNTAEKRSKFFERERELLKNMDEQGEYLFDFELTVNEDMKEKKEGRKNKIDYADDL
ncbi:hypothetical protein RFI_25375 [Reticulomyxa filosa]|uniref:COX assembly mitochondrial protein n=1 Tax=Reticulomyxa filosa TaxID=46433 RepID=X6MDA1_RETFI|nr:hypothetical protein RFI_25375 [Reticulomyxa filosa]|eukprot:ETO11998.1 hypothetical protein RFI_25375 [Reticulomyxa filosa]